MPPARLFRRLKVAAPRHMAKKNSLRSAPRMVRGRESERYTGLILCCIIAVTPRPRSGEEPGHEVDGSDGHADTEKNAGQHTLRTAFSECECEPGDDDGHERKPAGDCARKRLLQHADGVFPGRVAGRLRESRSGKKETGQGRRQKSSGANHGESGEPACFHIPTSAKGCASRRVVRGKFKQPSVAGRGRNANGR